MPRGKKDVYVDCDACAQRVPEQHLERHKVSPRCQAEQTVQAYEARGWRQIDAQKAKIAIEAGAPYEEALAGVHFEEVVDGRTGRWGEHVRITSREALHPVVFVPRGVVRVLLAFNKVRLDGDLRRRGVAALWDEGEGILAQVETIKRLSGSVRSYLWGLVVAAEEAKARGKNEAPAQVGNA